LLIAALVLATNSLLADDFKTTDGKEYKNVTVIRVEADGIVLTSKSGISKVYFNELPKDVQERFGYDAEKATKDAIARSWQKTEATEPLAIPAVVSSATPIPHVGSSAVPTKWAYSEHQDEMGRGTAKVALVLSSNSVHFGFPYQGETHAALALRKSPKYGENVMLKVERGKFVSSYTKNFITVRFDDGELWKFDIRDPEDGTAGLLFIHDNEEFIGQLRKAQRVKIEADFFQEGP